MSNQESSWISARAYALWEAAGRPVGRDQEHWHQAVVEYQFKERTKASHDGEEVLSRRRASVPSVAISKSSIRTVLVVEDEPRLRFDTVDLLESAGYTTLEAANADEALVLLKNGPVDSVITDINMPGSMDGLGLASIIRSLWPRTKIVVTSGLVRLRRQDLAPGIAFISKPAPDEMLLKLISVPGRR